MMLYLIHQEFFGKLDCSKAHTERLEIIYEEEKLWKRESKKHETA